MRPSPAAPITARGRPLHLYIFVPTKPNHQLPPEGYFTVFFFLKRQTGYKFLLPDFLYADNRHRRRLGWIIFFIRR